uniref:Putative secreted protein n=1 Tax=Anopheles darlingi TaxID=43151 RepID=A0A2M4DMG8_ANODA
MRGAKGLLAVWLRRFVSRWVALVALPCFSRSSEQERVADGDEKGEEMQQSSTLSSSYPWYPFRSAGRVIAHSN